MRKKRKARNQTPIIIILTVLVLLLATVGTVYFFFFNSFRLNGNWIREIDLSEYCFDRIDGYLADVPYFDSINSKDYMDKLPIKLVMTLESSGKLSISLDEESYNACYSNARDILKSVMSDVLTLQLSEAGIETDSSMDEMVVEALGESLDEYLDDYGPTLLPPLSELKMTYSVNGIYRADKDMIYRSLDPAADLSAEPGEPYVVSENILVISAKDGNEIYIKAK